MSEEKNLYTFENPEYRRTYWHTCSHVLAQAVKRLYPEVKLAIGPSIENGFYYDMDSPFAFTPEIMETIEGEMRKICKEKLKLERFELPREEAVAFMEERGEPYKVELINDLPEGVPISFYRQGEFTDLCAGPHLDSTGRIKGNALKLTACNAAYWRGDSSKATLQRIYGVAFPKKDELDEYLRKLEEAKRRDHRKLGRELGLFMTDELVGRGLPMFLPKGYTLWQILENYIREKERKLGYQHVLTPCIGTVNLYRTSTSGHWDHYKENMFPPMEVEDEAYVLRPMNCPHHMRIYANRAHSYRDLPIRIGEIAHDFRFEASGVLKGIERGRHFCQNDGHLFVTPEQIQDEFSNFRHLQGLRHHGLPLRPVPAGPGGQGEVPRRRRDVEQGGGRPAEGAERPWHRVHGGDRRGRLLRAQAGRERAARRGGGVHPLHLPAGLLPAHEVPADLRGHGRGGENPRGAAPGHSGLSGPVHGLPD